MSNKPFDASSPMVVGIGASAGGLDAFKKFFASMPADSDMAFVLVQHLDPHHKSMLVELLSAQTTMPVVEASDGVSLSANRVFIIPPDTTLTIKDSILHLTKPAPPRELRRPIDTFFSSLAEDRGENAACIVLAGFGSDGTLGVRAIREHGGLTLAQAEFGHQPMSGMPNSANATGLVDQVLPVEAMPARLIEHRAHLMEVANSKDGDGTRADTIAHLATITAILRRAVKHDFGHYKQPTLVRRVQRRMQVLQIGSVPGYIERLQKDPGEVELLFREILIGVTQFFRDPLAFDALQSVVVPSLFTNKAANDSIRVWVPGCATGEEVYSIAILLREAMTRRDAIPHVQIFGTDIDDRAIAMARTGHFSSDIQGVSPERRARWFTEVGDELHLKKEIREMCIFSVHSLVKDPPFSKLHMISCRNVLIYFDAALQDRTIRNFHYALLPSGFLFLGPSEGIARNALLFSPIDKKQRIFQSRKASRPSLPEFPLTSAASPAKPAELNKSVRAIDDQIDRSARRVIAEHSPAYFVVDQDQQILRFSGGKTGQYLEPSAGTASLDLFAILKKSLRPAVRAALQMARTDRKAVIEDDLTMTIDGHRRHVTLIVEPLIEEGAADGLCLVAFSDTGPAHKKTSGPPTHPAAGTDVETLERELATAKSLLRVTIDELETNTEEMKSANEEYQSVNEELQASNEELETAKEEMQSVNEELQTINSEMIAKNDVLTRLNSDLANLLDSTQIATIFLDRELHIKNFTPSMMEIFHLRESDRGRPLTDIAGRLNYAELQRDVEKVLRTLAVVDREVRIPDTGSVFIMRIRPYRTVANVIDGVVVTFVDVTQRKLLEEDRGRLAAIVTSSNDAVIGHALDGRITSWNKAAEDLFGYSASEAVGKSIAMLLPKGSPDNNAAVIKSLTNGDHIGHAEEHRLHKSGAILDLSMTVSAVRDLAGTLVGASTIARDIRDRKKIQTELKNSEQRFAAIINQATAGVAETDLTGRFTLVNPLFCEIVGRSATELMELRMQDITHPDDLPQNAQLFDRLVAHGLPFDIEKRYVRPGGSPIWVRNSVTGILDAEGHMRRALAVVLEITEHKRAEAHRELLMHELSHRVKNTLATVQSIAMQTMHSSPTLEAFRTAFMARLMALSSTHNLLGHGDWHGALLRDVVLAELSPYQSSEKRWTVEGVDVLLDPNTALAMGMALHELTTNAAKYGALSVPSGHVQASWSLNQSPNDRRLSFEWKESGGPPVKKSRHNGFGTRLVTEGLALQLDGSVKLDFNPEGIRCAIEIPLPPSGGTK